MSETKPTRSLAGIAGVIAVATLLSKIFGLVREQVIAAAFGVGPAVNAFAYAYVVPGFLLILLGGINGPFHSALLSVLSRRDRDRAALVETVTTVVTGFLLLVAVVLFIFAPFCIDAIAPGLQEIPNGEQVRAIAIEQLRLMTPLAVLAGWIGIGFGTLNAANLYWLPGISPLFSSLTVIGGIGILALVVGDRIVEPEIARIGGLVLAGGTLLGAVWQWAVQAIAQWRSGMGGLRFRLALRDPGVREVLGIMLPATMSSGTFQINTFVDLSFASYIASAAAVMKYASLVVLTPVGVLSNAILVPFLPVFSRLIAPEQRGELKERIRQGLVLSALTMLPFTAIIATIPTPIVRVVYERGIWDPEATRLVAPVLVAYGLGMFFYLARDVLVRVFYAFGDGATPLKVSVVNIVLNIVLDYVMVSVLDLGARGLVYATVGVNIISIAVFLTLLHRRLQGLPLGKWSFTLLQLLGATTLSAGGCWGMQWLWEHVLGDENFLLLLGEVSVSAIVALGIFALTLVPLQLPEVELLTVRIRKRLGR